MSPASEIVLDLRATHERDPEHDGDLIHLGFVTVGGEKGELIYVGRDASMRSDRGSSPSKRSPTTSPCPNASTSSPGRYGAMTGPAPWPNLPASTGARRPGIASASTACPRPCCTGWSSSRSARTRARSRPSHARSPGIGTSTNGHHWTRRSRDDLSAARLPWFRCIQILVESRGR